MVTAHHTASHDPGVPAACSLRWGAFVYRFRRPIVVLAVVIARRLDRRSPRRSTGALSAGGWTDPELASRRPSHDRLADEFGAGGGSIVAVFRGEAGADARSDEFQAAIAGVARPPRRGRPRRRHHRLGGDQDDRFISTDGTAAYVVVRPRHHRRGGGRRDARAARAHRPADRPDAPADRRRAGDRRTRPSSPRRS